MHFEESIEKIVKTGEKKDMEKVKEMFIELMELAKEYDREEYDEICYELYELAFGKKLNKEMAEEWVNNLRPEGRWTYAEAEKMRNNYGLNVDPVSFYATMNMMASDYGKILGEDMDAYVNMTKAFLNDEDADQSKLYEYYKNIARKRIDNQRR